MQKTFLLILLISLGLCAACQPAPTTLPVTAGTQPSTAAVASPTFSPTSAPTTQAESAPILTGKLAFYSDRDGNTEIYVMNVDGSGLVRLTNDPGFDDSPALSPDGRQVAFLTARHDPNPQFPNLKYELYVTNTDGSNQRRLTTTEAAEDHPAWSPDGHWISFDADYDGNGFYEIYMIQPDGSNLTRLTSGAYNDQFADWSPDGRQIAFSSDRNGNWDIFAMNSNGSNQQPLTDSPNWELFPAWSPDGSRMAFNSLVPRSRNTDIFLLDADGSNQRQLTDSPGFDENPSWSPDGRQIAFQTQRGGNFELYVMNPDGSGQYPLAGNPADELWPSWARSAPPLFEKSSQELGLHETFQAALGDLDSDGDLDAVFANPMRNPAAVWLNNGDGAFVDTGQKLTQYGHGVELADFDGDSDLDAIIVCHQAILPTKIYLNDGLGLFTDSGQNLDDARFSAADLNLLDLNGDGSPDIHVLYYSESGVPDKVYRNDGKGTFSDSGLSLDEDFIAWGDLDGDGDVDYFGKHWKQGYVVTLNDGSGQFTQHWQMDDPQATVSDLALADFDSDGDLDALIANGFRDTGSNPSRLLWNDGSGNFTDSGLTLPETMGAHFAVGDLDLDGDLDVFVTNMDRPNAVWLYENGQFVDSGLSLGGASEMSGRPTLGDLDGDGDLDLIVGRFRGGAEIWFNQTR